VTLRNHECGHGAKWLGRHAEGKPRFAAYDGLVRKTRKGRSRRWSTSEQNLSSRRCPRNSRHWRTLRHRKFVRPFTAARWQTIQGYFCICSECCAVENGFIIGGKSGRKLGSVLRSLCLRAVFRIGHHRWPNSGKTPGMAGYDFSLEFECPICGAPPKEKCVMMSGNFRSASHMERSWVGRVHQPKWSITKASPAEKLKVLTSGGGAVRKSSGLRDSGTANRNTFRPSQ
jgi:hypothetical protein